MSSTKLSLSLFIIKYLIPTKICRLISTMYIFRLIDIAINLHLYALLQQIMVCLIDCQTLLGKNSQIKRHWHTKKSDLNLQIVLGCSSLILEETQTTCNEKDLCKNKMKEEGPDHLLLLNIKNLISFSVLNHNIVFSTLAASACQ